TANTSVQINITITNASDLSEFKFNWNGTNYTFYNDSLVLMFNFDNVSAIGENATRAVDVSKQGNNGTITGAVWNISGRYGSTLNFDANNDYVVIPKETNLITGTNSFTIEAWINPKNPGGGVQNLIAWTEAGSAVQFDHISGAGSVAIWACSKSLLANNYNFTANVWSHIVYTRNGNSWRTYVNGAQIGTDVTDTCSLGTPNRDYYIGAEATAPSQFYNGSIDEFRIWNRSLTSSEINQSYISNLYKYANDSWAFYTNQSNLSAGVTYTYRGFVKDIAGNTNQTELRTLTISGAVPTHTAPILNSTNVTLNDTNQNLTCYNQSTSDADSQQAMLTGIML
ncbi:LamG domain-containing protein, partial [Candidatus Pacearchaeota archaeon]|nr:LamG domain-containing protein [Candidatus Pacearchaeota archaeon]